MVEIKIELEDKVHKRIFKKKGKTTWKQLIIWAGDNLMYAESSRGEELR